MDRIIEDWRISSRKTTVGCSRLHELLTDIKRLNWQTTHGLSANRNTKKRTARRRTAVSSTPTRTPLNPTRITSQVDPNSPLKWSQYWRLWSSRRRRPRRPSCNSRCRRSSLSSSNLRTASRGTPWTEFRVRKISVSTTITWWRSVNEGDNGTKSFKVVLEKPGRNFDMIFTVITVSGVEQRGNRSEHQLKLQMSARKNLNSSRKFYYLNEHLKNPQPMGIQLRTFSLNRGQIERSNRTTKWGTQLLKHLHVM